MGPGTRADARRASGFRRANVDDPATPPRCRPASSWRRLAVALGLAAALGAAAARAETAVNDFSAGPGNGVYAFASWTPKTLPELLQGNAAGAVTPINGHLFMPPNVKDGDKVPAVLFVHGSGGVYNAMLDFWPKQFNGAGWALFAMDSFGPRGVQSTADDQSQVPFAADTADAFAALRLLATHPRIDPRRIAVLGTSRGGITAWRSALERVIAAQKLPGGLRFAAHVQLYAGGCVGAFRNVVKPGVFAPEPMLWVHGDADDYTGMAPCQDYADRIAKAGTPTEFVVLPGARHKFDADDTRRLTLRGAQRTKDDCQVEFDIDSFAAFDRHSGARLQGDAYRDALKNCGAVGATVEGDRAARDKAAQAVVGFLGKVFAR